MQKTILNASRAYKKQVVQAGLLLGMFFLLFLALVLFATAFAAFCFYFAFTWIVNPTGFFTLFLGIFLGCTGIAFSILLFKFVANSYVVDREQRYEIKLEEEPRLFSVIEGLVTDIGTDFPHKVYLSADLETGVSYDFSFRHLFQTPKKNVTIGLGLVNGCTEAELQAILAHEFAHFSQKSMQLDRFFYHVNQIVIVLLFNNKSYSKILFRLAFKYTYFIAFSYLAFLTIKGMLRLLRAQYLIAFSAILRLTREMEYHADALSAMVCKSDVLMNTSKMLRDSVFHKMNPTNFLAFGGPKLPVFICGKHRLVLQITKSIFSCPNSWGKNRSIARNQVVGRIPMPSAQIKRQKKQHKAAFFVFLGVKNT